MWLRWGMWLRLQLRLPRRAGSWRGYADQQPPNDLRPAFEIGALHPAAGVLGLVRENENLAPLLAIVPQPLTQVRGRDAFRRDLPARCQAAQRDGPRGSGV